MTSLNYWENTLRNSPGPIIVRGDLQFPSSVILGGEIHWDHATFSNGLFIGANSTSASISYEDLSGVAIIEMNIDSWQVGGSIAVPVFSSKKISIKPGMRASAIFGSLVIRDSSVPNNEVLAVSTNIGINPNLSTTLIAAHRLALRLLVGYEFQIAGKLKDPNDRNLHLINTATKNPIQINGDGVRLGVSLGYVLKKNKV